MASSLGALCPGAKLGTPRSRVEGRCSWEGKREWSGMLVLWLNWALSIPRSFTEWPVPATETSGCGPLEVVPCLGKRLFFFSASGTLSLWPTSGGPGFGGGFLVEPEKERFPGIGGGGGSQPHPKISRFAALPLARSAPAKREYLAVSSGLQIL